MCIRTGTDALLQHISIYLDHQRDDSYTPQVISVRAGTHYHDLVEVRKR
jgi:anaphase-promoting complex subunit 10